MSNFFSSGTSTRRIAVDITGNTQNLERALGRSETKLKQFGRKTEALSSGAALSGRGGLAGLSGLAKGGGAAIGIGLATRKAFEFTQAASALQEQLAATDVVFGNSAQSIEAWSKTTGDAFGIAQTQAVAAANQFGALFKGTGSTQQDAARLSRVVVELAGDLASFKDTSVEDALAALRSGLSGEIEPLRRFQVFLTEASVAQEALAQTGKKSAAQLTQGEKIQARFNIILRQTKDAQGDAERTAGSLANQQRRLRAQSQELEASIGKLLLPSMTALVTALNDAFAAAQLLGGALGKLANVPVIEIPIKFITEGGRGGEILERVLLGGISPLALGIKTAGDLFGGGGGSATDSSGFGSIPRRNEGDLTSGPGTGKKPPKAPVTALNREQKLLLAQQASLLDASLQNDLAAAKDLLKLRQQQADRAGPKKQFEAQQKLLAAQKDVQDIQTQIAEADAEKTKEHAAKIKAGAKKAADAQATARKKALDALKAQAQAFKDQADAIKSAVLDAFDTKSQKIDNARALQDAKEALRVARQEGGVKGIQQARRDLQDAQRAVERQRLEQTNFRVTGGPAGPVNTVQAGNIIFNIRSDNPEVVAQRVLAVIQRKGKQNKGQQRGRTPGVGLGGV